MASVDLLFQQALDTTHPVDLVFGETDEIPSQDLAIVWSSTVPAPVWDASIHKVQVLLCVAEVPRPIWSSTMFYDNSVLRGAVNDFKGTWQVADGASTDRIASTRDGEAVPESKATAWTGTDAAMTSNSNHYQDDIPTPVDHPTAWRTTDGVSMESTSDYQYDIVTPQYHITEWQTTLPRTAEGSNRWQTMLVQRKERATLWGETIGLVVGMETHAGVAAVRGTQNATWWQTTIVPQPGVPDIIVPPEHRCYVPPRGNAVNALFIEHSSAESHFANLRFRCNFDDTVPPATKIIPVRKAYIVINDTHLRRVDDDTEVPVFGMSMSIDMDSWTWSFSADMHMDDLDKVAPSSDGTPVKLRVTINGNDYFVLAKEIDETLGFASSKLKISGPGHSAILADPYAPITTFSSNFTRTAQQLMNEALTVNGVPLGWEVNWMLDDWIVPAGAWSHQGTYATAVNTIAQAAGGFIHPDGTNQILYVKKRFAVKPWERDTAMADIQIPSSVIVSNSTNRKTLPPYNAVYVSGADSSGVLRNVVRTGTAGDVPMQMIVDPLITEEIAARQRGIAELNNSGLLYSPTLSMPVLPESGIVLPGMLVEYVSTTTIRGVVKGVSIAVTDKTVRQSFIVESRRDAA